MGQQQLLLLVLGTVIVGLAVVAGLEAYEQNQKQAAADHMTDVALRIASDVQAYAQRPPLYRSKNTTSNNELKVDFGELKQYSTNSASGDGDYVDDVATYSLNGNSTLPSGYDSSACPNNGSVNTVEAYSGAYNVSVCVGITGTSSKDVDIGVKIGS